MFKTKKSSARTMLRFASVLLVAVSLGACGFHLRGSIPLSDGIKNMYVFAPKGSFKDQLERILENGGAELAADRGSADVILNVTKASSNRRVGTLDERGKVNSYNLLFNVTYTLDDPAGARIRKVTKLTESRQYNFDPQLIVESESEEAELLEGMEESIALRMVRQLSSITDYDPKVGLKPDSAGK